MMKPNEHGVFENPLPHIKLNGKHWSIEISAVPFRGRWRYGVNVRYGSYRHVGAGGFRWPASVRHQTYPDIGATLHEARQEIVKHLSIDRLMDKAVKTAVTESRAALARVPIFRQAMLPGLNEQ